MLLPRTAAHVMSEIATLLELRGESAPTRRAYDVAARALQTLDVNDLAPMLRSGELNLLAGVGPLALDVLRDMQENGDSQLLEQLRENTPEGLLEMLRVPGLGPARIHRIHEGLGIDTLHELEQAARDGRLEALPRFGAKTAQKVLRGIAHLRASGARVLFPHARHEGGRLLAAVRAHPDVTHAELAGSLRRRMETIGDIHVVAACRVSPALVAAAFAHGRGVREVIGGGGSAVAIQYEDGTRLDLRCVTQARYALARWWATGSAAHCSQVVARAAARGVTIATDAVRRGTAYVPMPDEEAIYAVAGLSWVAPELRESLGEVEAAALGSGSLPTLITDADIRGALHCHSHYSDGAGTIAELAHAAHAHGWGYLGVSDHSQSAFYAGGLTRDAILRQHDEIDTVNATMSEFRVLKGIEADILPCGRVDYDASILDRFDYVIGSVHSRFGMNEVQMTDRVLKAMDDPHVSIVGHPTGRLLLTREPYAINVHALLEKAGAVGVAIELNADPHRLDLDWRFLRDAHRLGALIEIGPDAHSVAGLDNMALGVGVARKGWLEKGDVLNAQPADQVLAFAAARRSGSSARQPPAVGLVAHGG